MKFITNSIPFFGLFLLVVVSCKPQQIQEEIEENIVCSASSLKITKDAAVALIKNNDSIKWQGTYSNNFVRISYTTTIGSDGELETHHFVFKKIGACIQIERGYKFYDGKLVDISAITELKVISFFLQDWKLNNKLVGNIIYQDHHDKNTYDIEFWVEFTPEDFVEETTKPVYFSDCFLSKLPIDIDMNADDTTDFKLTYEEVRNTGNNPAYSEYSIKLISTDFTTNAILSPRENSNQHYVVFEPPFTTENTRQYFNDVKTSLDVFYEFDAPYQSYNYFLNNILTYRKILENTIDDYFMVSIQVDGNTHYGWIKFKLNSTTCQVSILETYLNPTANEHVQVL